MDDTRLVFVVEFEDFLDGLREVKWLYDSGKPEIWCGHCAVAQRAMKCGYKDVRVFNADDSSRMYDLNGYLIEVQIERENEPFLQAFDDMAERIHKGELKQLDEQAILAELAEQGFTFPQIVHFRG